MSATPADAVSRIPIGSLKIMNYYPADAGWTLMWTNYSHQRTVDDFAAMSSLGANTVRIIVQPSAVGYPTVSAQGASALADIVSVARSDNLGLQLTLFDWWSSYTDLTGSKQWAQSLLAPYTNDPVIDLVELQNEMPTSDPTALAWAHFMLPVIQQLLPGVPRTISAAGSAGNQGITAILTAFPSTDLEVGDIHYYGDAAGAINAIHAAQSAAGGRPIIIGESGLSTLDGAAGEEAQARYYRVLARITQATGLPPAAPWTYTDFTATGIPGTSPQPAQYHYGLRRTDGSWKPAAAVVTAAFGGQVDNDWDGGFEREVSGQTARLGSWTPFAAAQGLGSVATDTVRNGSKSVCFSGTTSTPTAVPSVEQAFPVLSSGAVVSVTAYVLRTNPTGQERAALAWYDANGTFLSQNESTFASEAGTWQQLTVTAAAPTNAATVQVHLKVGNETGRACWDDVLITW